MKTFFITIAFVAACIIGIGIGRYSYSEELPQQTLPAEAPAITQTTSVAKQPADFSEVAQKLAPSLVLVTSDNKEQPAACGIIFSEDGFILTAYATASQAMPLCVTLFDQTQAAAHFMWGDESLGLAVLKIRTDTPNPVDLSTPAEIRIGASVLALGYTETPTFSLHATHGIIATDHHTILKNDRTVMDTLTRTDTPLQKNFLGAPLLSLRGEILGICTDLSEDEECVVVPLHAIRSVIDSFVQKGTFRHFDFGFSCTTVSTANETNGMLIYAVEKNSPAAEAGLKENDILLSLNDNTPHTLLSLRCLNFSLTPGELINITYKRAGVTYRTEMNLLPSPQSP